MESWTPKAILLDLDDTLIDFSGSTEVCWEIACERFAPQAGLDPRALVDAVNEYRYWYWSDPERHRVGRLDLRGTRRLIVREAMLRLGVDMPAVVDAVAQAYDNERDKMLRLIPDTIDALQRLRELGIKLALVTNGQADMQRSKIARFGLEPYFDLILIEGEHGLGKPDERVYLHVLDRLGVSPSEAWMVGDNLTWEVEVPQRLGIKGIWYNQSGKSLPEGSSVQPDRIIGSIQELLSPQ